MMTLRLHRPIQETLRERFERESIARGCHRTDVLVP